VDVVLSLHFPERTEESDESHSQDSRYSSPNLNPGSTEYETKHKCQPLGCDVRLMGADSGHGYPDFQLPTSLKTRDVPQALAPAFGEIAVLSSMSSITSN
jgi:hypothetical protein